MKKIVSVVATTALTFLGLVALSFASIAPANASINETNVTICHYAEGQGGKFEQKRVSEHSIVKKTDAYLGHGNHEQDIVPPFDWNFGGNEYGHFVGQNWTAENETLWKNQCNPAGNPLTPVVPLSPQATCVQPTPPLTFPAQPAGVDASAELKDGAYVVTFTKPADTTHQTYWFTEGTVNPATVAIIPAGPGDPYWDDAKNSCNLPDTGAGTVKSEHVLIAGALIFAGLLVVTFARRRKA
jgi:hypothetical protein